MDLNGRIHEEDDRGDVRDDERERDVKRERDVEHMHRDTREPEPNAPRDELTEHKAGVG